MRDWLSEAVFAIVFVVWFGCVLGGVFAVAVCFIAFGAIYGSLAAVLLLAFFGGGIATMIHA